MWINPFQQNLSRTCVLETISIDYTDYRFFLQLDDPTELSTAIKLTAWKRTRWTGWMRICSIWSEIGTLRLFESCHPRSSHNICSSRSRSQWVALGVLAQSLHNSKQLLALRIHRTEKEKEFKLDKIPLSQNHGAFWWTRGVITFPTVSSFSNLQDYLRLLFSPFQNTYSIEHKGWHLHIYVAFRLHFINSTFDLTFYLTLFSLYNWHVIGSLWQTNATMS